MLAFILLYLILSLMSSRIFVHLFCLVRIENEDIKEKKTVSGELGLKAEWYRLCFFFEGFEPGQITQTVLSRRTPHWCSPTPRQPSGFPLREKARMPRSPERARESGLGRAGMNGYAVLGVISPTT
jgi:hypothetical protein